MKYQQVKMLPVFQKDLFPFSLEEKYKIIKN